MPAVAGIADAGGDREESRAGVTDPGCNAPAFSKVKEKREAEGDADEQGRDNREPKHSNPEALTVGSDKNEKHDRGHDDVEPEERADPSREQFFKKESEIEPVFHDPRDQLPKRQCRSKETKREVDVAHSHGQALKK